MQLLLTANKKCFFFFFLSQYEMKAFFPQKIVFSKNFSSKMNMCPCKYILTCQSHGIVVHKRNGKWFHYTLMSWKYQDLYKLYSDIYWVSITICYTAHDKVMWIIRVWTEHDNGWHSISEIWGWCLLSMVLHTCVSGITVYHG